MKHGSQPNARTLLSYEEAADAYSRAQPSETPETLLSFLDDFARLVPGDGAVLEIGSATGTDADLLEARGLQVQRTDAVDAFVNRLRDRGKSALELNVLHDDLGGPWAGIYANAVFLHLDVEDLKGVLVKAAAAAEEGGILGFSLKEGEGAAWTTEKLGHPRHFTYWREPALRALIGTSPWELIALKSVVTPTNTWLQCLCRKSAQDRTSFSQTSRR